ncbi:MAG: hypothetical protein KF886_11100 [Candidatus Hydrogenedentes bacterium]|nr:hypothetical protein [Candidatus Hydrogenedentota bacterium]
MSHSRDKGKHEPQKKAAHTLKEKRKLKREKKGAQAHPEEMVAKLDNKRTTGHTPAHG